MEENPLSGANLYKPPKMKHTIKVLDIIGFRTGKYNLTQMKNNSKFQRF